MKPYAIATLYIAVLGLCLAGLFTITGCAGGQITPTASTEIQSALSTVANVLQQQNTGVQTAAPTLNQVLAATHNQGDSSVVNEVVAGDAMATPALEALLGILNVAIKSNTGPAQIAAVNKALSPATTAAIVAPASSSLTNRTERVYAIGQGLEIYQPQATRFKITTGLRPRFGWVCAYNVY